MIRTIGNTPSQASSGSCIEGMAKRTWSGYWQDVYIRSPGGSQGQTLALRRASTRNCTLQPVLCDSCGADAGKTSSFCPFCGALLTPPAERDPYLGTLIARKYRVEKVIGEGGMGRVYQAHQLALDKPVVLKVLHRSLLADAGTVARFEREARAASRLHHPNSITVLDFGRTEDGSQYIAMELVTGRDLHQILASEWPLPEGRVARIVAQVLSALADAHGAGVIHRDLKPENIMVEQRRGGVDFVKVLDFGIAKFQESTGETGPALTKAGFVCGTPEYMSPEQARGADLDPRSDLYAVGVILYQLTTGVLPFSGASAVEFATKHLTHSPLPPTQRRPDLIISPAIERLILKALSKNPVHRPQTALAFRAELLAIERGESDGGPSPRAGGAGGSSDRLERTPGPGTLSGSGMLVFKLITVLLLAASMALASHWIYQPGAGADPFVIPPNAPLPHDKAIRR